jgi:transposase InsO family protein
MGSLIGKLYQLDCEPVFMEHVSVASNENNINVWHQRLGHINEQQLKMIIERNLINGVTFQRSADLSFCRGCVEGKMHRKPFKPVGEIRSVQRLQLVHSDVCGPMHTESLGGYKYFVTFIDDYSRCCSVYFLKQKSEVFEKFKEFEAIVTNECGRQIGALRTDNGGEYVLTEFEAYLKLKGIRHEFSVPHVPEQNGVSERMNRTLMECARTMIAHAGLPNSYWAEAIATAAYVRNRMPTAVFSGGITPYERWYQRKPNVSHLKVFGCIAYAYVSDAERRKLDKKAKELRFVGYSKKSKGYRLFDDETHKIITSRDVIFNETVFDKRQVRQNMVNVEIGSETTENKSMEETRHSERQRRPPVRFGFDEYADTAMTDPHIQHFAYKSCHIVEPETLDEALASDYAKEWKAAADQEYKALIENDIWDLVELPRNRKSVGCKWVFKVKYADNGNVEHFKGRLVAKGYTQKYGIDYDETFSPVVRFSSIRALLAFAVQSDMQIHQMDVVSAFLNGRLDDEIYMQQPDGYIQ